ncbi:uncharacterized protein LOC125855429 [Solanum stenotomum]|uniref:uncharacterized protein LOC125855429 n=1 Tax=Solanum stenotomum TaxID=172797 RepID=UPI0020CFEC62|nr:uncharacterized protein LOC125855429 [Solanum stenotomum]
MSVKESALRFTQLSKYAPTIVVDSRARMSKFILGVSELVVKECRIAILVHDMDISHLMVHAQQIEEEKLKERSRETKRARIYNGNSSYSRSGGRGHSRFRQRFFGQGSSNAPNFNANSVSNPKPQGGNVNRSLFPNCAKCVRKHDGKGLTSSNAYFGCGKMDHKIRDFPSVANNVGDKRRRAQPYPSSGTSGSVSNAHKKNMFYAL